jgi:hypothetical protein
MWLAIMILEGSCEYQTTNRYLFAPQPPVFGDSPSPNSIWVWGFDPDFSKVNSIGVPEHGTLIAIPKKLKICLMLYRWKYAAITI